MNNIRFLGELFKLKMLSETIMHECIVRLLRSSSDEHSLEMCAILITTTGKDLDHPDAKVLNYVLFTLCYLFMLCFAQLYHIAGNFHMVQNCTVFYWTISCHA